ncbi:MAG: hypothetical protein ACODAU_11730 [Myxococcota bacterium]
MRRGIHLTILGAVAVLIGCRDEPEPVGTTYPETSGAEGEAGAAEIGSAMQEPHGTFLVGTDGRALYMFTADEQGGDSTCYDDCAAAWPPVLTDGEPVSTDPAIQSALLGTVERRDGRMQVTYDGWPLYFYVRDRPGDVMGQDVHGFGGEWYLLSPEGEPIAREHAHDGDGGPASGDPDGGRGDPDGGVGSTPDGGPMGGGDGGM